MNRLNCYVMTLALCSLPVSTIYAQLPEPPKQLIREPVESEYPRSKIFDLEAEIDSLNTLLGTEEAIGFTLRGKPKNRSEFIRAVYAREVDADPAVHLQTLLAEAFPHHASKITAIFSERLDDRERDDALIHSDLLHTEEEFNRILNTLKQREFTRTAKFSKQISQIFSKRERSSVTENLIRKLNYRAVTLPLVAEDLGLHSTSHESFRVKFFAFRKKLIEGLEKDVSLKTTEGPVAKAFAAMLKELSHEQLKKTLICRGKMSEADVLEDALISFPERTQPYLEEVFLAPAEK